MSAGFFRRNCVPVQIELASQNGKAKVQLLLSFEGSISPIRDYFGFGFDPSLNEVGALAADDRDGFGILHSSSATLEAPAGADATYARTSQERVELYHRGSTQSGMANGHD